MLRTMKQNLEEQKPVVCCRTEQLQNLTEQQNSEKKLEPVTEPEILEYKNKGIHTTIRTMQTLENGTSMEPRKARDPGAQYRNHKVL